jgi:hypothetical protein
MNDNNPTKPVVSDQSKIAISPAAPHTAAPVETVKMPNAAQPKVTETEQPKGAPKAS